MGRWVQAGLVNLNLEGFLRSPPIAGLPTARLAFSVRIIRMFPSWRGVAQDGCQRFSGSWGVHRRKLFTSIGQKPFSRSRSQEAFDLISLHVVLQVIRHQDSLCQGELPGNREKQKLRRQLKTFVMGDSLSSQIPSLKTVRMTLWNICSCVMLRQVWTRLTLDGQPFLKGTSVQ